MALLYELKFPSGKKYIGVTSRTLGERLKEHAGPKDKRRPGSSKLKNAIKKYGLESVEARVIKDGLSYDQALVVEKVFIEAYDTKNNGYNLTDGGEGVLGRVRSKEESELISKRQRERFQDPKEREKISKGVSKYIRENPEAVERTKEKRKAVVESESHRKMMSDKMKQSYKNNPEFIKANQQRTQQLMDSRPDLKTQISRSLGGTPIEVYKDGVLVDVCDTLSQTGRKYNASIGTIGMVISGKRNHTKGYTFKRKYDV